MEWSGLYMNDYNFLLEMTRKEVEDLGMCAECLNDVCFIMSTMVGRTFSLVTLGNLSRTGMAWVIEILTKKKLYTPEVCRFLINSGLLIGNDQLSVSERTILRKSKRDS